LTEKELSQYRSLKKEIVDQEKRINILYDKELPVVAGKVSASMKDFPYTEIRVGVQMYEPKESDELQALIAKKEKRLKVIRQLVLDIEDFISNIQDSELRQIFEYRYIDGKLQLEIGSIMHIDRSRVSRKIHEYLQNAHIAQKNVI
jgi:hypothetical protein